MPFQPNPSKRWFDVMKLRAGHNRQMTLLHLAKAVGREVLRYSDLSDAEAELAIEYFRILERGQTA